MSVTIVLRHSTRYRYDRPVALGPHEIRLHPAPVCRAPVSGYVLAVRPERHTTHWYFDAASNPVARILFQDKAALLEIDVEFTTVLVPANPFDFFVEPEAERYPLRYGDTTLNDLSPFLALAESGERLRHWLTEFRASEKPEGKATIDLLVAINRRLKHDIVYVTRLEHGVQSCEETLKLGRGSCRDSGWLLVQILRHLGVAARFVSGYLVQLAGNAPDAPKEDNADLHAWAEAYLPGAGWIGFDPTSGLLAAEGHIPLARAATPALAAPVTGSVEPCRTQLEFSMSLRRLP